VSVTIAQYSIDGPSMKGNARDAELLSPSALADVRFIGVHDCNRPPQLRKMFTEVARRLGVPFCFVEIKDEPAVDVPELFRHVARGRIGTVRYHL